MRFFKFKSENLEIYDFSEEHELRFIFAIAKRLKNYEIWISDFYICLLWFCKFSWFCDKPINCFVFSKQVCSKQKTVWQYWWCLKRKLFSIVFEGVKLWNFYQWIFNMSAYGLYNFWFFQWGNNLLKIRKHGQFCFEGRILRTFEVEFRSCLKWDIWGH